MDFAEVLREHWPRYVEQASGAIPSRAWAAVEAVLSCRTARRGGHLHHCAECRLFLNCKWQTTNILQSNSGESRARFYFLISVPCGALAGYSYQVVSSRPVPPLGADIQGNTKFTDFRA